MTQMRYTKSALLVFGLGLVLGFAIVVGEFSEWERTAAAVMALGLVSIPVALFADGRGPVALAWIAGRLSRRKPKKAGAKPRAASTRRKPSARPAAHAPRRKRS